MVLSHTYQPSKLLPNAATAEIEGWEGKKYRYKEGKRRKSKLEHHLLVTLTSERNLSATKRTNDPKLLKLLFLLSPFYPKYTRCLTTKLCYISVCRVHSLSK
jgi:hypothetical protein